MTLEEKIDSVPKLERIDSSIDSCIKILEQELEKRKVATTGNGGYINYAFSINDLLEKLQIFKHDFNVVRGKIRIINE